MGREEPRAIPDEIRRALTAGAGIELIGDIDKTMVERFLDQLASAKAKENGGGIVLAITSSGGDPDLTRRIQLEIERARSDLTGPFLFLGKSVVYSAAVSIMAAFPCRDRYLTRDAKLLVHGRTLGLTLDLAGPLRVSRPRIEAVLGEIDLGMKLEEATFRSLIGDSGLDLGEVIEKAMRNWYLSAEEAKALGLVADVV
jgi:ATP-dependent protease ClpP protease subunit